MVCLPFLMQQRLQFPERPTMKIYKKTLNNDNNSSITLEYLSIQLNNYEIVTYTWLLVKTHGSWEQVKIITP